MKLRAAAALAVLLLVLAGAAAAEETRTAGDAAAFREAFAELADGRNTAFTIEASRWTYEQAVNDDHDGWHDFFGSCGVLGFGSTRQENGDRVTVRFEQIRYYSGKRIWAAAADGDTARLTERERETLRIASGVASRALGTPPERERYLHDWLCGRVRYYSDGEENDNDCAVGALLDGLADCDGYADAFFLLCRLSGIEACYVNGDASDFRGGADSAHMWNAVLLDRVWVMTDVTWDDQEDAVSYLYYNIGTDRLRRNHSWPERLLSFTAERRDLPGLRDAGLALVTASSAAELDAALRDAAASPGRPTVIVGGAADTDSVTAALRRSGASSWSLRSAPGAVEISGIDWPEHFFIADTEEEAVAWINRFADSPEVPAEIAVRFSDSLGRRLYADSFQGVERVLALSRLTAPVDWSYTAEGYCIHIRNPVFGSVPTTLYSAEDMRWYLLGILAAQPERVSFMIGGDLTPATVRAQLPTQLFRNGVAEIAGWNLFGDVRVLVTGITYEAEYRVVTDRQEAVRYLRDCRSRGVTACRVYCPDGLYEALMADGGRGAFALMEEAGWGGDGFRYSDTYRMLSFSR